MTELLIENNQEKTELTNELTDAVKAVCDRVMETEDCNFDAQISITFTDNEGIREINAAHRGIDKPTDVLSFPMLDFDENGNIEDGSYEEDMDTGYIILGDIIISLERAAAQAEEYGHSLLRETAFLCAHSMLHLLGYDHVDDPEGERIMIEKQKTVLNSLGITRN